MERTKEAGRKYDMAHIFYNDTLWVAFFLMNALHSLGQVMVKYNYSSVSDTNPISIAIHGGIYLIGVVFVLKVFSQWRCVRCGFMEAVYFILKVFILLPEVSATFSYLLAARAVCMITGAVMGHTVFKKTYQEIKNEHLNFNSHIVIPMVGFSLIIFVIVYHRYILLMAFGAFILWFMTNMFAVEGIEDEVVETSATACSGCSNSSGSSDHNYQRSYHSEENGQQERIAFSQYDFTTGNFADDIDRIDF